MPSIVGKLADVLFSNNERIIIVRELARDYITGLQMADSHTDLTGMTAIQDAARIKLAVRLAGILPQRSCRRRRLIG